MLDAIPIQLNPSTIGRADDGEGREVGNVLDSGRGVGNGVDRDRVDIVVDKLPAHVPTFDTNKNDKKSTKPTTITLQHLQSELKPTTAMTMAITKWAKQHSHARTIIAPLAKRDPTRQYAVGIAHLGTQYISSYYYTTIIVVLIDYTLVAS